MLARHTALKAALARHRRAHAAKLRSLCAAANGAAGDLGRQLAAARRLLALAELCSKLEPPGGAAGGDDVGGWQQQQSQEVEHQAQGAGAGEQLQAQQGSCNSNSVTAVAPGGAKDVASGLAALGLGPSCAALLAALLARTNAAELDCAALRARAAALDAENAALRGVLGAAAAATTVRPDAVDGPLNTLLVVNGRLQRALTAAGGTAARP